MWDHVLPVLLRRVGRVNGHQAVLRGVHVGGGQKFAALRLIGDDACLVLEALLERCPLCGRHGDHAFAKVEEVLLETVRAGGDVQCGEFLALGGAVSYTHLRAHETVLDLVCRLLLEKKKTTLTLIHEI